MKNVRNLQRFDFGTLRDFRGPIQFAPPPAPEETEAPPPPPPAPTFSEEELQLARIEAKKLGYNEGFLAGQAQAQSEADAEAASAQLALQTISQQVAALSGTYAEVLKRQSLDVSELVLMIAKKVADEALLINSVDTIAALVTSCLPAIYTRPRITVEMNPATMKRASDAVQEHIRALGYEGEVLFRGNPAIAVADARVDWGSGYAERSTDALWRDIEMLLARVPVELEIPQPNTPTEGA